MEKHMDTMHGFAAADSFGLFTLQIDVFWVPWFPAIAPLTLIESAFLIHKGAGPMVQILHPLARILLLEAKDAKGQPCETEQMRKILRLMAPHTASIAMALVLG